MKKIFTLLPILGVSLLFGQVHINEFDMKTKNNNAEIFIELKSAQPNYSLDGYQLVFVKQDYKDDTKNYLYYKINLVDVTTDKDGFLVIGSKTVNPQPTVTFNTKIAENTPMIVGLYYGADTIKMYEHNDNLKLIEGFAYNYDSKPFPAFYTNIADNTFSDIDDNLSFQRDEYFDFVTKKPTPGYDFYNPKVTFSDDEYITDSVPEKVKPEIAQKSSTNFKTSKFYFPDGRVLEGYFPNEIHTGKGVYTFTNGDSYEGDIVDDEMTGFGVFKWKNGDRYEGMFLKGVLNGRGTMYFTDGDRYEGFFKNNLFHGKGKLLKTNGKTEEGEFFEGNIKE